MESSPTEICEKCGASMELIQPLNPAKARCPVCGHELDFLWDPMLPTDPHGNADGVLVIESFNGNDKLAAIELRSSLGLTPAAALELVRSGSLQIPRTFGKGLRLLFDLKERLDEIGVSSRIERKGGSGRTK